MTCPTNDEWLSRWMDHAIHENDLAHAAQCEACGRILRRLQAAAAAEAGDDLRLSQAARARILDGFDEATTPAPTATPFFRSPWLAVAATVLILLSAVAVRQWRHGNDSSLATGPGGMDTTNVFMVLQTDSTDKIATVQPFTDFKIRVCRPGDTLGAGVLQDVQEGALVLRDAAGQERSRLVEAINAEARAAMAEGIRIAGERKNAGALTTGDLNQLMNFAYLGQDGALQMLEQIAEGATPIGREALALLCESRQLNAVNTLVDIARTPKHDKRRQAIEGLARMNSPLAMQTLRALALDDSYEVAAFTVDRLAQREGAQHLSVLQAAAESARDQRVRDAAKNAVDSLLKGIADGR